MKDLTPKDHAEAVATFRHAVIGPVCARELSHGDLTEALREIAATRVRPPGSMLTKTYSVPTLERWLSPIVAVVCLRCGPAVGATAAVVAASRPS